MTIDISALAAPLPDAGIERTLGSQTQRGYNTTGYGYQWCVNRFNEVCNERWGFTYEILREASGTFERSGKPYWDVTVAVSIWVDSLDTARTMPGGHVSGTYTDALKGAVTNGFKKAAAMWGVGRQAYEGTIDDDSAPADEGPEDMRPPLRTEYQGSSAATPLPAGRTTTDAPTDLAPPREHWCAEHNTAFQRRSGKDGSVWYSHKQGADGWCNEKEDKPSATGRTPRRAERAQTAPHPPQAEELTPPSRVGVLMAKRDEFAQAYADAYGWDLQRQMTTAERDDMAQGMRVWLAGTFKRNDPDTPHELSFDPLSPEEQDTAIGMLRAQARGEQQKKERQIEQEAQQGRF